MNIFERVINALNTPLPGTGKQVPKPVVPAPAPASDEAHQPAVDLQAELRRRAEAIQAAQKAATDAEDRRKLDEAQQHVEDLRREMDQHVVAEAQTHVSNSGWTHTVSRGDTLSAIAQHYYGKASLWPKIYDANRDKIKNPNLIYPGQVFVIPDQN